MNARAEQVSLGSAKRLRRAVFALVFAGVVLIAVLCSVAPAVPAATNPSAPPTPAQSTSDATSPPTVAPVSPAPEITSPPDGRFVGLGSTVVSGTRAADQEIQVLSPVAGHDPLCIIPPDDTTNWSCTAAPLPSGPAVTLRAVVSGNAGLDDSITVPILGPPTVTGGAGGAPFSDGRVRGTAYPGASVTVSVSSGGSCTADADTSGAWACTLPAASDRDARVSAHQQADDISPSSSNESTPVVIHFDVTKPAAPTVTAPVNGARVPVGTTTYFGTGEDGATVTVFAGPYSVCTAPVADGRWSCAGSGVAAGSYPVIALQQDAAGNASAGSTPVNVTYGAAPTPSATPESPSSSAPGAGSAPSQGDAQSEGPGSGQPSAGQAAPPAAPPSTPPSASQPPAAGGAGPTRPHDPGGWGDPTRFAAAVVPPGEVGAFPWQQALLLALGVVILVAIPARLLAGTVSRTRAGRPRWHLAQLTGRNRVREEFETAPQLRVSRTLVAGAALVAAAALILLSGPVADQPAYLRLLMAVVIALVLVNAAATLVPWWWSTRVLGVAASVSFLPRYLLLVAVTALGSRLFNLDPALLFGLLGSVAVTHVPTVAVRGQLAAVRAASLIVVSLVGWLTLGVLRMLAPASGGFVVTLTAEIANTVVLAAIGSAVLVLIPVGRTSGRGVLAWSPPVWAGLTVLAFTMLFVVLSPSVDEVRDGVGTMLWVAAAAFAALSVGAWAWQRFVVPALR